MPSPAEHDSDRSWLLGAGVALVSVTLVVLIVVVAPRHLLDWDTSGARVPDRAKAINDIRATLLQGLAGLALLVGAFFTWRQLQVSRHGQLTGRFTAAVEQLGHSSVGVRIGAIFALERIAVDSRDDRGAVVEVLCLFAQRNALALTLDARPSPRAIAHSQEVALAHAGETLLVIRSRTCTRRSPCSDARRDPKVLNCVFSEWTYGARCSISRISRTRTCTMPI
ncbi:hypothetical protein [Streptomyces sp. NPDC047525]|uniref:hypothetical protein n=1 Tax=Streptomyces sp. NPDC047525 TaxID=3155264 RepID=UPI003402E0E9